MRNKKPKTGLFINKSSKGEWFWHLKGKNGKVIAHGHGFNEKRSAIKSINSVATFFKNGAGIRTAYDLNNKKLIWV